MTRREAIDLINFIEKSGKRLYDEEQGLINTIKTFSRKPSLKQGLYLQKIYCRVYGGGQYLAKGIV